MVFKSQDTGGDYQGNEYRQRLKKKKKKSKDLVLEMRQCSNQRRMRKSNQRDRRGEGGGDLDAKDEEMNSYMLQRGKGGEACD